MQGRAGAVPTPAAAVFDATLSTGLFIEYSVQACTQNTQYRSVHRIVSTGLYLHRILSTGVFTEYSVQAYAQNT